MRNRKVLRALAAALVFAAVGAWMVWPRPNRITRDNFDRIKDRMTRAEVEAILGPPGDYTTQPNVFHGVYQTPTRRESRSRWAHWLSDTGYVDAEFSDREDVVGRRDFYPVDADDRVTLSPLDRLRWRAERLWRRWFP